MTPKQAIFVKEYLVDLNATQAATRAGYSAKTAYSAGQRLLKHVDVAAALASAMEKRAAKLDITAERVLGELALIGFANMQDYVRITHEGDPYINLSEMTREQAAAIAEVTTEDFTDGRGEDARDVRRVKLKFHDKKGALTDLGRHLGLFREKLEVDVSEDLAAVIAAGRRRAGLGGDGN
jgi:phage terminase small subunit